MTINLPKERRYNKITPIVMGDMEKNPKQKTTPKRVPRFLCWQEKAPLIWRQEEVKAVFSDKSTLRSRKVFCYSPQK